MIRGPASALYGNAAGGGIQLETEEAPAIPLGQEVEVTASYALRGWFVTGEGRYASEMPVDDANEARSPAYFVAGLRTGMERLRLGGWSWSRSWE